MKYFQLRGIQNELTHLKWLKWLTRLLSLTITVIAYGCTAIIKAGAAPGFARTPNKRRWDA